MKLWYVYIMSNKPNGVIYIGITDNIEERVKEHKIKLHTKAFTARYNCDKLIYFEEFKNVDEAIVREKQFKKWKRKWKVKLIEEMNPNWSDISLIWDLNYRKFRM